jgi:hypothetical protein
MREPYPSMSSLYVTLDQDNLRPEHFKQQTGYNLLVIRWQSEEIHVFAD